MHKNAKRATWLAVIGLTALSTCATAQPGPKDMTFFVTSAGNGKGANLGGLDGADAHCQTLAKNAGAGERTWRAYLSTQAPALNDPKYVNARDRIGTGPWQNAKGVVVARSVDDLHSPSSNLNKSTAIDEKGQPVKDRSQQPSQHDILTGSRPDGTAFPGAPFFDMTCGNWTKGGNDGTAMVGHFDLAGPLAESWATSWNSSHPTSGCDQQSLVSTGGAGLLYCFAAK
ncbi:MAG TPA: hypothetical protein VFO33_09515 [Casimicrobiaceae bacterium]|nr:hypothetical protein [Casimicrobiaceae bacterium]